MKKGYRILFLCFLLFQLPKYTWAQQMPSAHIQKAISTFNLTENDWSDAVLTHSHISKKSDVTHFYYQQTLNGIAIRGANMDIHTKGDKVLKTNSSFIRNINKKAQGTPQIDAKNALTRVARYLNFPLNNFPKIHKKNTTANQKTTFEHKNIALEPITTELVYIFNKRKKMRLAWEVSLYELSGAHWWFVTIDAETGEVLKEEDRVLHCDFGTPPPSPLKGESAQNLPLAKSNRHTCQAHSSSPFRSGEKSNSPADGSSYKVYPLRIESPNHGTRTIITDPAEAVASPFGWHDINGAAGAEFTITRGNNVHTYDDLDGDNNTSGYSPDGGDSLNFDFSLDLNDSPKQNLDASITNLFYWNNLMHDVWYHYGFDEVSGNYQANNYGRGGLAGDYVEAQAQDGSGTNNANFSAGTDGTSGRMQMYIWQDIDTDLRVNMPTGLAGNYNAAYADFGPQGFSITGDLIVVSDTTSNPTEGCDSLVNIAAINGNIALIDRGTCSFSQKVANAQAAGAIGVLICNNVNGTLNMGGDAPAITIPSVMIAKNQCDYIRTQIPTVNVTLINNIIFQSDSDLDNGIIAHEYGHGVSIRLTGGSNNSSCLNNDEQAGEGWSDWMGLVMTANQGDTPEMVRGIGTYSLGKPTTHQGIRTHPYSTDMTINPHTYDNIKTEIVPHGVGSVWCAMIWDLYWNLVDAYGYDADMYYGTGGNNIAMNLVIEGLKLQPCSPGFIDARDAILLADQTLYNGENECLIWESFARRGLGYSASQGSSGSRNDGTEAFDLPPQIRGATILKTVDKTQVTLGDTLNFTLEITGGKCYDVTNVNIVDSLPVGLNYLQNSASDGGTHTNSVLSWTTIPSVEKDANFNYTYQAIIDSNYLAAAWDTLWYDNADDGTANWQISNVFNESNWTLVATDSCGSASWYAAELEANPSTENQYLTIPLTTLGMDAELIFTHWFNTEANWDGGTVELSDDGGSNWIDLGAYMTQNSYNDYIKNNPADQAFAGSSGGCIETKIDLSSFAGANALIRFNFYYDQYVSGEGWYVDNIYLASNDIAINTVYLTSDNNSDSDYAGVEIVTCTPVELYTFLEGAYDPLTNEMTTTLNTVQGLLPGQTPLSSLVTPTPAGQPYNIAPWNYTGTEGAEWTDADYADSVVDWVLLSFRAGIEKSTEIAQVAALLHKDGRIEALDQCILNTSMDLSAAYTIIEHRNHMGIMTPLSTGMSNGKLEHDFRTKDSYRDPTGFGQKSFGGAWVMYAGDMDQSDVPSFDITATDKFLWVNDNGKFSLYLNTDLNLDGDISGEDKTYWNENNGISSRVPK